MKTWEQTSSVSRENAVALLAVISRKTIRESLVVDAASLALQNKLCLQSNVDEMKPQKVN
jgi:hypothetical protein